jgi:hypothetical protein
MTDMTREQLDLFLARKPKTLRGVIAQSEAEIKLQREITAAWCADPNEKNTRVLAHLQEQIARNHPGPEAV